MYVRVKGDSMRTLAIFPARAGSKRIPHKNITEFMGEPMLARPIRAAIEAAFFDEVMVSTDSEEIGKLAESYGASFPFLRSDENASDHATTDDVILEVIEAYRNKEEYFDAFFCIYPTAVLLTADILKEAGEMLMTHSSVMPVVRFSYPPQRGIVLKEGKAFYAYPEYKDTRSQDLEPLYHDAGLFYACRTEEFLRYKTTETPDTAALILSETQVQDIDNESDMLLAEMKLKSRKS